MGGISQRLELKVDDRYVPGLGKRIEKGLHAIALRVESEAQTNILKNNIMDRGLLLGSSKVVKSGPMEYTVIFDAPHAVVHEFGAGPRGEFPKPGWWAPLGPLIKWCRRKGIRFDKKVIYKKDGSYRITKMTYKDTARMVQRGIRKNGIAPRPFLRPALDKVRFMSNYIMSQYTRGV